MVFGLNQRNLENEVFCLTEERDFLRSKLLDSVSQLKAMENELKAQKKEVLRLRQELMSKSKSKSMSMSKPEIETKKDASEEEDQTATVSTASLKTPSSSSGEASVSFEREDLSTPPHQAQDSDAEDADSAKDIRQSAEKLLQWASYRSSMRLSSTAPLSPGAESRSSSRAHPVESIQLDHGEEDEGSETSDWED